MRVFRAKNLLKIFSDCEKIFFGNEKPADLRINKRRGGYVCIICIIYIMCSHIARMV